MGIVLYELLTGRVPFNGNTPPQVHVNIVTRNPPPRIKRFSDCVTPINPDATGIAPELEKIVLRAIEKDKRRRFGGCAEFEMRLRHYTDGERHWWQRLKDSLWQFLRARRAFVSRRAVIGSLFLILLLAIAALFVKGLTPPPSVTPVYGLRLVKSVDPATVSTPGTVVTYSYAVTNTGNVAMRNVAVIDEGVNPIPRSGDTDGDGALDLGETWVYEARVLIDQSHFDAGGVLVGTAVASSGGVKADHKVGVTLIVHHEMKMSTLVNGAKSAMLTPPGPVTYTYTVSNVGNARLTGVRMTDKPPMKPRFLGGDTNQNEALDPGESWQYDATVQITEVLLKGADTFVSRAVAVSEQVTSQPDMATVTISRPPSSPRTVTAGVQVKAPQKTKHVDPEYPSSARSAGVQGQVVVALIIGTDGRVESASTKTSIPALDPGALVAAKQWEYAPTAYDGEAVRVAMDVGVDFKLVAPQPPMRVGGSTAPLQKRDVRPVYPPEAKNKRIEGVVIIEVTLTADGRVQDARILRGIPLLNQAALDAVRQWEYQPTLVKGVPVPVIMTVTVQFPPR
jgi:protein TonB